MKGPRNDVAASHPTTTSSSHSTSSSHAQSGPRPPSRGVRTSSSLSRSLSPALRTSSASLSSFSSPEVTSTLFSSSLLTLLYIPTYLRLLRSARWAHLPTTSRSGSHGLKCLTLSGVCDSVFSVYLLFNRGHVSSFLLFPRSIIK